jgi:hypothetical protein
VAGACCGPARIVTIEATAGVVRIAGAAELHKPLYHDLALGASRVLLLGLVGLVSTLLMTLCRPELRFSRFQSTMIGRVGEPPERATYPILD